MFQTATLSQGLNRLTFEGFQQSKYSYLRWGRENQALPVAKMRSVFVSVGEWRKKGRQAGGLFKQNFDFSHQQFSTGSSVGLATYPSSWTGGRVSKWMGGRKVSLHREQSVRQPKKDCDGKKRHSISCSDFLRPGFLPHLGSSQHQEGGYSWQGPWKERCKEPVWKSSWI